MLRAQHDAALSPAPPPFHTRKDRPGGHRETRAIVILFPFLFLKFLRPAPVRTAFLTFFPALMYEGHSLFLQEGGCRDPILPFAPLLCCFLPFWR